MNMKLAADLSIKNQTLIAATNNASNNDEQDNSALEICPYSRRLPTGRKCCAVMTCTRNARSRGEFCIKHGGGVRCAVYGCSRGARDSSGLCIKHGGGPRCKREGCKKGAADRCEGYCVRHFNIYGKLRGSKRGRDADSDDFDDESEVSMKSFHFDNKGENLESKKNKKSRGSSRNITSEQSVASDIESSLGSMRSLEGDNQNSLAVSIQVNENDDSDAKSYMKSDRTHSSSCTTLYELGNAYNYAENVYNVKEQQQLMSQDTLSSTYQSPQYKHFSYPIHTVYIQKEPISPLTLNPLISTSASIGVPRMYQPSMLNPSASSSSSALSTNLLLMNRILSSNNALRNRNAIDIAADMEIQRALMPISNQHVGSRTFTSAISHIYSPLTVKKYR